eukprot:3885156-Pyramimonas_sp.AAC.1
MRTHAALIPVASAQRLSGASGQYLKAYRNRSYGGLTLRGTKPQPLLVVEALCSPSVQPTTL